LVAVLLQHEAGTKAGKPREPACRRIPYTCSTSRHSVGPLVEARWSYIAFASRGQPPSIAR